MKSRLRVKEVATAHKISMTKLSQRSEVSYNTIKFLYRNPYSEVYVSTLTRLAQVLDVPTASLLEDVSDAQYEEESNAIKAQKKNAP